MGPEKGGHSCLPFDRCGNCAGRGQFPSSSVENAWAVWASSLTSQTRELNMGPCFPIRVPSVGPPPHLLFRTSLRLSASLSAWTLPSALVDPAERLADKGAIAQVYSFLPVSLATPEPADPTPPHPTGTLIHSQSQGHIL